MKIVGVHHVQVTIPAGTEEEARDFYCGILGLWEIEKPEVLQTRGGFWLQCGDQQIHVGTEEGVDRSRTKAHVAYEVDDLVEWKAELQRHGVDILDSLPIPEYDRFEFRDPFGNRVECVQPVARGS